MKNVLTTIILVLIIGIITFAGFKTSWFTDFSFITKAKPVRQLELVDGDILEVESQKNGVIAAEVRRPDNGGEVWKFLNLSRNGRYDSFLNNYDTYSITGDELLKLQGTFEFYKTMKDADWGTFENSIYYGSFINGINKTTNKQETHLILDVGAIEWVSIKSVCLVIENTTDYVTSDILTKDYNIQYTFNIIENNGIYEHHITLQNVELVGALS